ncbi:MAG: efflux RND transporter periplasmic adaptor subunit [Acidobacteriaceae bacterium]|nr:efflux RND transporter periplasmic adaptor subunit [Acidobacteriaceae bacterium]
MTRRLAALAVVISATSAFWGCSSKGKVDENAAAPPPARVTEEPDLSLVKVDRPERFKLVNAVPQEDVPQVHVTGVVTASVDRSVPVVSLASGRVVGIFAKLGDDVVKGQLLLKVLSNDITNAFATYRQAVADEELANKQFTRAKTLYDRGAISLNDLQVAQDTEQKALVTRDSSAQAIRTLGADPDREDAVVNVYAPVTGTIVEQNTTQAASVHTPDNQQNLFTIADLSEVWVLCDVYENDLPAVRLGDMADIELNAYPGHIFHGRISNIGKILDPNLRTAKVRIVLQNPGTMRQGMFVTATFYGLHGRTYAAVPTGAVLHLHDRDWVFVPETGGAFRRTEVMGGKIADGKQLVLSGISPGQQVVSDALALSAESEQ